MVAARLAEAEHLGLAPRPDRCGACRDLHPECPRRHRLVQFGVGLAVRAAATTSHVIGPNGPILCLHCLYGNSQLEKKGANAAAGFGGGALTADRAAGARPAWRSHDVKGDIEYFRSNRINTGGKDWWGVIHADNFDGTFMVSEALGP